MILISHRGNINGKNEERENAPDYIDEAIAEGYDVEVDVWMTEDGFLYSGHDEPQYRITQHWLEERNKKLWIHCKSFDAMRWFTLIPELNNDNSITMLPKELLGICSDYIINYKNEDVI